MFFLISKLFSFLLTPMGVLLLLLLYAMYTHRPRRRRNALLVAVAFLFLTNTPAVVSDVQKWWEHPPVSRATLPPHEVGIVLTGGMVNTTAEPRNLHTRGVFDRAMQPFLCYQEGKIKKILISGGEPGQVIGREAAMTRQMLIRLGVKPEDILLEGTSLNTYENARNTAKIMQQQFAGKSCVLFTSAFHMRRSLACFRKQGLNPTPYGTSYNSVRGRYGALMYVPQEDNFSDFASVWREILGLAIYKLVGYA